MSFRFAPSYSEETDPPIEEAVKREFVEKWKQRYPGMKSKGKGPGQPKKKPVKYSDLKPFEGKPKANLTQRQLNTFNEFIKVKEGETQEQWEKRTRRRRLITEKEITQLSKTHKLQIHLSKRAKSAAEIRNNVLRIRPVVRDFDFMKYYGIVINFYSIKYGIRKDDLEVGFYFYEGIPFTRERFDNACILNSGVMLGKFMRFKKSNYIAEIIKTDKRLDKPDKKSKTGLFQLSKAFANKLTYIYRVLGKMNGIRMYHQKEITPLNEELREIIYEMNLEIMEIQTGKKPQEK
jgi:hypothetical protein